ncbi:MAG TPA: phosphoribosylanthranilate isomerase [Anaeromyxobacteraceae bacterium]|nr:phosphoribosylanthranilate isomerase [Anaeromyxobacteraceae bacterium]
MTVRVKICGLRRPEDARAAVRAGADALGFNFWPGSRRYLPPAEAGRIVRRLPPFVAAVGVFVNAIREEIAAAVLASGVGVVQLHGDERPESCLDLPVRVVKAVRVASESDVLALEAFRDAGVGTFLLDAPSAGYGGSGARFDWALASAAKRWGRVILAGGLDPGNVAEAIRAVRPWGVDVASGVEAAPGVKDAGLMERFVSEARAALPGGAPGEGEDG